MKLQMKVTSIFDRAVDVFAVLASILIAYLIISVTVSIILRGLRVAAVWMFETTEYSLVWITFLGAAWVLRDEGHVKMDLLLTRLDQRSQTILNIVTSIIGALVCLTLTWFGVKVTWHNFQTGYFLHTVVAPPLYPILIIIPLGSFLLFLQFLRRTSRYFRDWRAS